MTHTIVMPDLGQTTAEGKVLRWLKNPGEKVSKGDHLLEVETDKVTMDVECYVSGYMRQVLAAEGQMVSAMAPIALVTDTLEEPLTQSEQKAAAAIPATEPAPAAAQGATPLPTGSRRGTRGKSTGQGIGSRFGVSSRHGAGWFDHAQGCREIFPGPLRV